MAYAELQPLKGRVAELVTRYENALENAKAFGQETLDFVARHLYEMTGDIMMSLLILRDASVAPELFVKAHMCMCALRKLMWPAIRRSWPQ